MTNPQVVYCVMETYGTSHDRLHSIYLKQESACNAKEKLNRMNSWGIYYVEEMAVIDEGYTMNTPLKHCPFCGSVADRTGGSYGGVTIDTARCSNRDCIASFKSVDSVIWNRRVDQKVSDVTTTEQWVETGYWNGFCEKA